MDNNINVPSKLLVANSHLNKESESRISANRYRTLDSFFRRSSAQDLYNRGNSKVKGKIRRFRSMSDISEKSDLIEEENVEVFPSLPDNVLDKLGLQKEKLSGRLTAEEIETKFSVLSLAFSIDSTTINSRYDRQRRYRDQAEKNVSVEIERLREKANNLNKLCVDMESTYLFSELLDQIEKVSCASLHASSSSERFGAVQHENKLTDAVQLMVSHVNYLKQQRDQSRLQLQYTKKVLQENSEEGIIPRTRTLSSDENLLIKRRASMGNTNIQSKIKPDEKKILRRISESALKAVKTMKKPSRLDLGIDLDKIQEGTITHVPEQSCSDTDTKEISDTEEKLIDDKVILSRNQGDPSYNKIILKLKSSAVKWQNNVYSKEAFIVCVVFLLLLSLIFLCNIFFELQLAKT